MLCPPFLNLALTMNQAIGTTADTQKTDQPPILACKSQVEKKKLGPVLSSNAQKICCQDNQSHSDWLDRLLDAWN